MASVFPSTSKSFCHRSHCGLVGSFRNESSVEWMTCNCASKRVAWTTFLPLLSFDSKRTSPFLSASEPDSGGAIVTASRRKLLMLEPNLRRASSAASSAFSMSFRRLEASDLNRDSMPSASLTMSAGRESGRSGWASGSSFDLSVASLAVESGFEAEASLGWTERFRAWLMRFETPSVAVLLNGAYCLLAVS